MSLVGNIADVITEIGAKLKDHDTRLTTLEEDDVLSGATSIAVVAELPESPDPDTVYLVFPT